VLAFALLTIYGLSRVYLEIGGDGAVALAAGLSIGVLIISFGLAMNPRAPGWVIGGVLGLAALALIGGTIWAVSEEDGGHAEAEVENGGGGEGENGGGGGGEGGGGASEQITLGDNFFEYDGEQAPTITVPAGSETVFEIVNDGSAIHNMHVAPTGEFVEDTCEPGGDVPCSDPNIIPGGDTATITINLAAGEYPFRCDFHKDEMTGTLVVE
jgi:plastocyanin